MSLNAPQIDRSLLVVIDVQGKLAGMMSDLTYLRHVQGMIRIAQILGIPVVVTEQAPEKIGETVREVKTLFSEFHPVIKQTFSCCAEPRFIDELKRYDRTQMIVCGIESHVCVYQTVRDLRALGYDVQLVTDAVSSRSKHNAQIGIERCAQDGAKLTSLEMLVTELIQSTAHPKFREIMAMLKENK